MSLTVPKKIAGERTPFGFRKFPVSKFSSIRGGEGRITIFRRTEKLKNVGKGWDSNPYLALQNLVVLPIVVPWEQLEFLTNVSEIIKIHGPTQIPTRTYCLRNFSPHRNAETIENKDI